MAGFWRSDQVEFNEGMRERLALDDSVRRVLDEQRIARINTKRRKTKKKSSRKTRR